MLNPMTHEFVRVACKRYPQPLSDLIMAVDSFAYTASWPIETLLGEYAGDFFNAERLRDAVRKSIWDDSDFYSRGAHGCLVPAFNQSGLAPDKRPQIFKIVQDEAFSRIEQGIVRNPDGEERFREHGHHGRQYIARNSTARVVREVLPALSKALLHHYLFPKKA